MIFGKGDTGGGGCVASTREDIRRLINSRVSNHTLAGCENTSLQDLLKYFSTSLTHFLTSLTLFPTLTLLPTSLYHPRSDDLYLNPLSVHPRSDDLLEVEPTTPWHLWIQIAKCDVQHKIRIQQQVA